MEAGAESVLHEQLVSRRNRIVAAISAPAAPPELRRLLEEVDAALDRHAHGTYGICETCGDPIEADLLRSDPLARFCIEDLSPRERDALERDLALAGKVQGALLPKQDVRVAGWEIHWCFEPAGPVSGDYCDLVLPRRDTDGALFAVGDVSGKGVAASLLSAHLNALFRTLADMEIGVGEMMQRANRLFCESTLESHFATLVAGRAAPDGTVELCNAGQGTPVVLRAGGVEPVRGAGLPLGLFCSGPYPSHRIRLAPGESLILYTDGVTESRNALNEEFGIEGLSRALGSVAGASAAEVARASLDAAEAHRGDVPNSDDLTLLVLRREKGTGTFSG